MVFLHSSGKLHDGSNILLGVWLYLVHFSDRRVFCEQIASTELYACEWHNPKHPKVCRGISLSDRITNESKFVRNATLHNLLIFSEHLLRLSLVLTFFAYNDIYKHDAHKNCLMFTMIINFLCFVSTFLTQHSLDFSIKNSYIEYRINVLNN